MAKEMRGEIIGVDQYTYLPSGCLLLAVKVTREQCMDIDVPDMFGACPLAERTGPRLVMYVLAKGEEWPAPWTPKPAEEPPPSAEARRVNFGEFLGPA